LKPFFSFCFIFPHFKSQKKKVLLSTYLHKMAMVMNLALIK